MGKGIAVAGGLIAVIGPLLGIYIAFLGMWYTSFSATILNVTVTTTTWFDVLGSYHAQVGSISNVWDPNQMVQILGIILLVGGVITILGGLVDKKAVAGVGASLILIGVLVFALMLPSILDSDYFLIRPYWSDYSIYFTMDEGILSTYQMLGGGFWAATIGGVLGLIGMSQLNK